MKYLFAVIAVLCLGASIYFAAMHRIGFGVLFFIGTFLSMLIAGDYQDKI